MMKKVLCFLLIAAVIAQICARPDDKADAAKAAAKAKEAAAAKPAAEAKDALKGAADDIAGKAKDTEKDVADEAEDDEPVKPKPKKHHHHHKHHGMVSGWVQTGADMLETMADFIPIP